MSSTATATLQTAWDCRWSRPGHQVTGIADDLQPETPLVCVRNGARRSISSDECEECPDWEPDPMPMVRVPEVHFVPAVAVERPVEADRRVTLTAGELQALGVRTILVLIALGVIATGFTLLTSPLAVPITVALWLGAAALVGFAVFGTLPTR